MTENIDELKKIFYEYANLYKIDPPPDIKTAQNLRKYSEKQMVRQRWTTWKDQHLDHSQKNKSKKIDKEKEKFESYEERQANIDREWYVYSKLHEKGLENTNVEKLLDIITQDIQQQHSLKQDIESKIGFLTALWGVMVSAVITSNLPGKLISVFYNAQANLIIKIINVIFLVCLIAFGILSLVFIAKSFLSGKYGKYLFDQKEINFKCAVDDKYMSLTKLLDSHTTIWIKNERANANKNRNLGWAVKLLSAFICFVFICYVLSKIPICSK